MSQKAWDDRVTRPAELPDPQRMPHRAKKDRRRWCRGKEGVEHVLEIKYSKWATYWQAKNPEKAPCRWTHWWKRVDGKAVPDYTTWHWTCGHVEACANCGKILDVALVKRCPDYHHEDPPAESTPE